MVSIPVFIALMVASNALFGEIGWWFRFIAIMIFVGFFAHKFSEDAKRKLQNHSDEMLELLYNETKIKMVFKKIAMSVLFISFIGLLFFENVLKTKAKCSVISSNVTDDSFLISGEPNYGFSVSTILKNSGKDGNVFVHVSLSSSEGDLERKQTVFMKAGETRSLKYQFVEPTVNATNVRYSVTCTPSSE